MLQKPVTPQAAQLMNALQIKQSGYNGVPLFTSFIKEKGCATCGGLPEKGDALGTSFAGSGGKAEVEALGTR